MRERIPSSKNLLIQSNFWEKSIDRRSVNFIPMAVFKKVIGQDSSEAQKLSLTTPEERSYSTPAQKDSSSPSYGSQTAALGPITKPQSGAVRNVLSSDVEIKGIVKFQHDLIVDGNIEGEIHSAGNLTVGENARIKAEIKTGTVVIYGKVHGNIAAVERVELKASAEVVGDIKAKTLVIEGGAIFVGKSTVGTPTQAASAVVDPKPAPTAAATVTQTALAVG